MAVLGPRFCARALVAASRGHSSSRCAGLSLSWPLVAEHRLQTRRLSSCGSRAQLLRGMRDPPRPGRARTRIPCIGRKTLNHCATREALKFFFLNTRFFIEIILDNRRQIFNFSLEINVVKLKRKVVNIRLITSNFKKNNIKR